MRGFRLTKHEMSSLARKYQTPFVVISTEQVVQNYLFFRRYMPKVNVFYAMKANPSEKIIQVLANLGASFDTASAGEMKLLHDLHISGEKMIYANPVKTLEGLQTAKQLHVRRFTFDDASEIPKMARELLSVPNAKADVLLRIRVHNEKALVDLNEKFGADPNEAVDLLLQAKQAGLNPVGIAFHVGSQSLTVAAYEEALLLCRKLFDDARQKNLNLTQLDIGGGFPIPALDQTQTKCFEPMLAKMMTSIQRQLTRLFPTTEIWSEPGRFLAGTAVNLVTSVIGTKTRNNQPWYVIDDGVYGTFSGAIYDHWTYDLCSQKNGEKFLSTVVGHSCDSIDVVRRNILLPKLSIGDLLLTPNCGAYTTASASNFNGFALPKVLYYEDEFAEKILMKKQLKETCKAKRQSKRKIYA